MWQGSFRGNAVLLVNHRALFATVQHDRDLWVKIELFLWLTPWDKRLLRMSSHKNSFGRYMALLIVYRMSFGTVQYYRDFLAHRNRQ